MKKSDMLQKIQEIHDQVSVAIQGVSEILNDLKSIRDITNELPEMTEEIEDDEPK